MANYAPQEFLQTNVHNAATYPDTVAGKMNRKFLECVEELYRTGVNYDIADERTLEQFGQSDGGKLALGNCAYHRVILPEGCELNSATRHWVEPFPAERWPPAQLEPRLKTVPDLRPAIKSKSHGRWKNIRSTRCCSKLRRTRMARSQRSSKPNLRRGRSPRTRFCRRHFLARYERHNFAAGKFG